MTTNSLQFERVPLAQLRRHPNNIKVHTDAQIEQLRASIRRYGFNDPIGVDANYVIIEGDGRFQAALAEGLTEVPVVVLSHLTEKERDAYAIAHNQTQLSTGLDVGALQGEFERLDVTADDYLSLGFTEADALFIGVSEPEGSGEPQVHETGGESQEWTDLIQPIVKTSIRFTDGVEYVRFTDTIEALAHRYPNLPRVSDRILQALRDATGDQPL